MPKFTTVGQLEKHIMKGIEGAVEDTMDMTRERMDVRLDKFYGEYTPEYYKPRTKQLGESLQDEPTVYRQGNTCVGWVSYTPDNMSYPDGEWDGGQVFSNAMVGAYPHGGWPVASGMPIWIGVTEELKGAIPPYLGSSLIANGIPVKF